MRHLDTVSTRLLTHRSSYGFQISRSHLCHLFHPERVQNGSSLSELQKRGGPSELAARLVSSPVDGIETITINQRREM